MTNASAIKQLETIISKLMYLNFEIEGNTLQSAIRDVSTIRDGLESKRLSVRRVKKNTK